ncbi:hypothetical protein GPK34_00840 [Secundilactobacillus kimchicus]|uniref:hypothetical protein n=1 Tax=Secundilactobacillus kimchicus TaxID=528209 RepID=UPI001C028B93|nr:hypothetical protein [Secundilactobacillus kimchicus]MBT9670585.1 hypothetical protein [Secundilactobacillus kimchicus]
MAIPSVDSYLQRELKQNLQALLAKSYIIKEVILKDFSDEIVNSFINTYCTDAGHKGQEIPVSMTFPSTKQPATFILVQFKGGTEFDDEKGNSLGGVTGLVDQATGDYMSETATLTVKPYNGFPQASLHLKNPISELESIPNYSGETFIDGNVIYLQYASGMSDGDTFKVFYSPQSVDHEGHATGSDITTAKGYDVMENYTIDTVSNNNDTIRCLEAIFKTIFIYMKQNMTEQTELRLSKLTFAGNDLLQEVNTAENSLVGEQLYYRRIEISYLLTYSVNTEVGTLLDSVSLSN